MDGDDDEALGVSSAKTPVKRGRKTSKKDSVVKEDEDEDAIKEEASDS